VELDQWETKEKIIKEKKKLGNRKIFIDRTVEERQIQRKLRERARKERREKL